MDLFGPVSQNDERSVIYALQHGGMSSYPEIK